jgi:1-deoxy-D-xylulose-5-phosphate synthase
MPRFEACGRVIQSPEDVHAIPEDQWSEVADSLRRFLVALKAEKPAHMASSLTATEISVALHAVYRSPYDRIAFDVGHQAYAHKVLTGRAEAMVNLRNINGPSGFLWPGESPHDLLVTGHSSTSLSVMAGLAYADKISGITDRRYAVVIGDGAMTAGVAYEALNFIGQHQLPVTIILNDNDYAIDPTMGGLHLHGGYEQLMSSMRIGYRKNINGHDVRMMVDALRTSQGVPVMLHCYTRREWVQPAKRIKPNTFTGAVSDVLHKHMAADADVVLVTPAMISGAGWNDLKAAYPDRVVDVGIAEQHAVAMCAGLIKAGKKPVCHLYSTFFQRAVDQFIHDVAIEGLAVTFLIDRAGLVGEDGPTHHGVFDLPILLSVPGVRVLMPTTPERVSICMDNIENHVGINVIRYPRDSEITPEHIEHIKGSDHVLVYYGAQGATVRRVIEVLKEDGIDVDVLPIEDTLDFEMLDALKDYNNVIIFNDAHRRGGLGVWLVEEMIKRGLSPSNILNLSMGDHFISHGKIADLRSQNNATDMQWALNIKDFLGLIE